MISAVEKSIPVGAFSVFVSCLSSFARIFAGWLPGRSTDKLLIANREDVGMRVSAILCGACTSVTPTST